MKKDKKLREGAPNGAPGGRPGMDMKVLKRVLRDLFRFYPVMAPMMTVGIIFAALVSAIPAVFLQQVTNAIDVILKNPDSGLTWSGDVVPRVLLLIGFYVLSIIAVTIETQMAAIVTQGFLGKMRKAMFDGMQDLPIKYFDTHKHGDIMSYYTNDIDTLRQLVGQSFPTLVRAGVIVVSVFFIMLYYSVPLTLLILTGVIIMILVSKKLGGGFAKYFIAHQKTVGKSEGYVQEMMNGQKVIKVFNRERLCLEGYDKINGELFEQNYRANANANMLGPIIMNIGNVIYVIAAITGCMLLVGGVGNPNLQSLFRGYMSPMSVSIIVAFLSMT